MNTFGRKFRVTIFGESHGNAIGINIDGLPSGIKINTDEDLILTIHSMLKGWDKNIFYKIDLQDGNVDTSGYKIPKMTYLRRRKL